MHNKIQYDMKVNMAIKAALIGIVKEHACYEIALIRGGCSSTEYEIVTRGRRLYGWDDFARRRGWVDVK